MKKKIIELQQKMSDAERQIGQSNIADAALKKTRKYCGKKKQKTLQKKKKKNIKHLLKVKQVFFLLKNLHVM